MGDRNIVISDLLGDFPFQEPNQEMRLYKIINVINKCTPTLGSPIGTVERRMSQNSGQATPPLRIPQIENNKHEKTSKGKNATAVWEGLRSSGY